MKTQSGYGLAAATALALALAVAGCGGGGGPPQLGAATPAVRQACTALASGFNFPSTTITAASVVPAGSVTFAGQPIAEHCLVTGAMDRRTGANGAYAIGFEMRLPTAWNGRFYYQANGGTDGSVVPAIGTQSNASALKQGFAVISSDAGHTGSQNPTFGIDPQARLDYGYQALGKLTPMAKAMIATAYGKGPDRSYIGGCSNGGRHTMVAASRYADQYDGYLVGDPGTVLPHAALANTAGAQAYAKFATNPADLSTGFTQAERLLVSKAVLAKCDALDGATDGLIQATKACQLAFDLNRDVPTCAGARDGTCLSAAQKTAIAGLFAGAKTGNGTLIYSSWPYDSGFATAGWAFWKFTVPVILDSGALAMIWQVPPADPATFNGANFALTSNIDSLYQAIHATNATYTEDSLSFMAPPHLEQVNTLVERGAKMMIYHGTSDPIFSSDHSVSVWERWNQTYNGVASNFARLFLVPGMNHCSGGPSTDQFDMLTPLVNWVENGQAPDAVIAGARGPGNAGGVNNDVPASWSPTRTRPLCPYPQIAKLKVGATDLESAASFSCE